MKKRSTARLAANYLSILVCLSIVLTIYFVDSRHSASGTPLARTFTALDLGETTNHIYLPVIANPKINNAYRMGFADVRNALSVYPELASLQAGWYTNWSTSSNPLRPNGIEYVQMIRVHQKLSCGEWFKWNRETCPYAQPLDYVFKPGITKIKEIAKNNPGAIWLVGNEMDRVDFSCGDNCSDGQDEILPETYARAYHDISQLIRSADPTAQIAIGGLVQPTPLRLDWLTIVWDTYKSLYEEEMSVDIWNIHNFILQEDKFNYGAAVPPGLPGNPTKGEYIGQDYTHTDHEIFDKQIRAMRQWMKDREQQQKPLVITEYGVLYSHSVTHNNETINFGDPKLVHNFMLWTFDYFMETKDCSLGFQADDCRLVQRWLWFSLDHAYTDGNGVLQGYFNPHTSLFDATSRNIFPAGELFRQYTQEKFEQLSQGWVN